MKLILAFLAILFPPALSICDCPRPNQDCIDRYNEIYDDCDNLSDPLFGGIFTCKKRSDTLGLSKVPPFIQPKISYDVDGVVPVLDPLCGCVTGDAAALIKFEKKCCKRGGDYAAAGNINFPEKCPFSGSKFFPVCIIDSIVDCDFQMYLDWVVCKYLPNECRSPKFHEFGLLCPAVPELALTVPVPVLYPPQSSEMKVLTEPARRDIKPANKITKDQGRGGRLGRGRGGY